MIRLLVLLSLSVFTLAASADSQNVPPEVELELVRLEHRFAEALWRKDAAALDTLLADDLLQTLTTGDTIDKRQALATVAEKQLTIEENIPQKIQVRAVAGAFVVTGETNLRATLATYDLSGRYRFTHVIESRDGRWQIVVIHGSKVMDWQEPEKSDEYPLKK